jgi:hypothetical protein
VSHPGRRGGTAVTSLYVAGALLVAAQLIGLYGLKTRKADLVFSLVMAVMIVVAVVIGVYGESYHLHHS